uniref:Uncharacterized protein n=1 Tax=Panagrolaimus davidi TaxID=227884 RepID=A0A914PZ31_9BILA
MIGYYGLSDEPIRFTIYQLRILFESIIVLTVMTGYRESIAKALNIIHRILKTRKIRSNPWIGNSNAFEFPRQQIGLSFDSAISFSLYKYKLMGK